MQCIEDNRLDWGEISTITYHNIINPALNVLVGDTGRVGVGGILRHATSWQHKAGSYLSRITKNISFGRIGKALGRAALFPTIIEGFYDIGTIGRCLVVCKQDDDICKKESM
jgi:hypothetical protein